MENRAVPDPPLPILAAVSGGADSVWLLHVLAERFPGSVAVGHVNHGTRGRASDEEAAFVEELAGRLGVPFHQRRLGSVEARDEGELRRGRLEALFAMAREAAAPTIALGHHRDDLAETFLLAAARGAGPAGLSSMRSHEPLANGLLLYRPLLPMGRGDIRRELHSRGLEWREDPTNDDPVYTRNAVRHRVLPALGLAGITAEAIARSAVYTGEWWKDHLALARPWHDRAVLAAGPGALLLCTRTLREDTPHAAHGAILHHALRDFAASTGEADTVPLAPNRDQHTRLLARLREVAGDEAHFALRPRVHLFLGDRHVLLGRSAVYTESAAPVLGAFRVLVAGGDELNEIAPGIRRVGTHEVLTEETDTLAGEELDPATCAAFPAEEQPLVLRPVGGDDPLALSGGGTKSATRALQEAGIPAGLRPVVLGLYRGGELLWIPGVRRSATHFVDSGTKRILVVRVRFR